MKRTRQTQVGTLRDSAKLTRALLLTLFAQLVALAMVAAPAFAVETHLPLPFSPITGSGTGAVFHEEAGSIAVDETTGNVFYYDGRDNILTEKLSSVYIFGADGGIPIGVAPPYQIPGLTIDSNYFFSIRDGLAMDNSATSPNKGTLYVSQAGGKKFVKSVTKFVRNPSTEQYEPGGKLIGTPTLETPGAIAVDAAGNVYVVDNNISTGSKIYKFSPTGAQAPIAEPDPEKSKPAAEAPMSMAPLSKGLPNSYLPVDIALDGAGNLFVLTTRLGDPNTGRGSKLFKYPLNGSGLYEMDNFTLVYEGDASAGEQAMGIDVDPVANSLYVAIGNFSKSNGGRVYQYDATTLVREGEFGAGTVAFGGRVGVNVNTGRVYVSDRNGGQAHIDVFGPGVKVPTLTVDEPTGVIGSRATFRATVNPENVPITECKFEYGTTESYGSVAPCESPPPGDDNDHLVTAKVNDLTPNGVTYHVRLVAGSPPLVNASLDRIFLSGAPAATDPPTNVTGAKATLNGTVLPLSLEITECKFEYGPTDDYGLSVPCAESVPADDEAHEVSADIENLLANGAIYHYRVVTNGEGGPVEGNDEILTTEETFLTGAASAVSGGTATLNGSVSLEGVPLTDCRFEYGLAALAGYESSAPCQPLFSTIPNDSATHPVTGALSGLVPGATYRFRLVAENTALVAAGEDPVIFGKEQVFKSSGKPVISSQTTSAVGTSEATLEAQINPSGAETTYYFEWGTSDAYGTRYPAETGLSAGSGSSFVSASATISGLEESTSYHFRVVAENEFGVSKGPDRVFLTANSSCPNSAIRGSQGLSVLALPDCMALEMVSPPLKEQQGALAPNVSIDGNRVLFNSIATLGGSPSRLSAFGDDYVATRGPSGWVTDSTTPPAAYSFGQAGARSFSPDFSTWFHVGGTVEQAALKGAQTFRGGLGHAFSPLSPSAATTVGNNEPVVSGASADHSRAYLGINESYFPGDPQPGGSGSDPNVYVAGLDQGGQPSLALFARDRDSKDWGANCGVRVGGQGSISADGGLVYFTTRPDQAASGPCLATSQRRIMAREETVDGPEISEVVASECTRVSPPCSSTAGDDFFQGASVDQTRVYFTTNRQLADTDRDGGATPCGNAPVAGCDLYLYDSTQPAGERLTQVSAGDGSAPHPGEGASVPNSVVAISGDGSHVYFVARSTLTTDPNPQGEIAQNGADNLYVFRYPERELSFVGTLQSGEHSIRAYAVPVLGTDGDGSQIGGDGHTLVFHSGQALTADDGHPVGDIFRYDADARSLERISRAAPGGTENGAFAPLTSNGSGAGSSTDFAVRGRWVSEDGTTVVFTTKEALLPDDANGVEDAYMWRGGRLFRLPGSAKVGGASISTDTPTISPDGATVAYVSVQKLLPFDGDTVKDVYVARVGGGYPLPPSPVACHAEVECQGAPGVVSGLTGAASSSLGRSGNVKEAGTSKCRKGKVLRHGKCVKKKKKKGHHKKSHKKRAPSHRGGGSR